MNVLVENLLTPAMVTDKTLIARAKKIVLRMYNLPEDMEYFCGALPCSLMRADLHFFEEMDYMVCEKTDGVRFLMLVYQDPDPDINQCYSLFIDRGFRFYYSNVKFSPFLTQGVGTLFDGEIIHESTGFKYYVHDLVCLGGKQKVATLSYQKRMEEVTNILRWSCFPTKDDKTHIELLPKHIYPFKELPRLWHEVIPHLSHESDGLIFTPNDLPHKGKKNRHMFKYKNPLDHTLDFKLGKGVVDKTDLGVLPSMPSHIDGLGSPFPAFSLDTWDTKVYFPLCETAMSPERWKSIGVDDPEKSEGIILECKYNPDRDMWHPISVRNDKLVPNDQFTVNRTIQTMMEALTLEELFNLSKGSK